MGLARTIYCEEDDVGVCGRDRARVCTLSMLIQVAVVTERETTLSYLPFVVRSGDVYFKVELD